MSLQQFKQLLEDEITRIDSTNTCKRHERIIESFTDDHKAIINGKEYTLFNSNDYLGLRFNQKVRKAEVEAAHKYGSGPGAVRFISGSMKIYHELEDAISLFHKRESAMVFSSAFAANMAVIHCMIKGQSKDSLISNNTLVISDALNHRSIIDGIRVAGLPRENKIIFNHLDLNHLDQLLKENTGKFDRVIIISDGIFSMVGEYQDINKLQQVAKSHDNAYSEGVLTIVDDAHGVAGFGATGRGTEEYTDGMCDILIGTLGKGFGSDGGYVTGDAIIIDYLRESAATYIYSNPFSPGTAGAGLAAIRLLDTTDGENLLKKLRENTTLFKKIMLEAGFKFAADSHHAIQPILIGDAVRAQALTHELYNNRILVTNISYPVVPPGKDEIRIQISSLHAQNDIEEFVEKCIHCAKKIGI